jgi:hypothetical protein
MSTTRLPRLKTALYAVAAALLTAAAAPALDAQITERARPAEWKNLVPGARFQDRFLPMREGTLSSETWGAKNVIPRFVDNGIEDRKHSYWGGNILRGDDGKFHLFVCGWLESSRRGHHHWPNSDVFHAVADAPSGPFRVAEKIGPGHNPEAFRARDGQFVIYVIGARYTAPTPAGPWQRGKFTFDTRDRRIIEGLSNLTFAQREDGSYLMVCRGGGVWFSETGLTPYHQVTDKRVYPPVAGEFEDPVVWRDHVQYHLIVNDWLGRIAWYLRSKDGVNWVTDPGEAYTPGIARHADGHVEDWFKYERMKVFQDRHGRAIQANFAVIDVLKNDDRANDNHSSKNITIPLNPGLLLTVLNAAPIAPDTAEIRVRIAVEDGFDPHADVDISTLRFGASSEVNFGRGAAALRVEKVGADLVAVFAGADAKITPDEFAPKLLGRTKRGALLYGYARVPGVNYNEPILSARKPAFNKAGGAWEVEVQNFGQVPSAPALLRVSGGKGAAAKAGNAATASIPAPITATSHSTATASIPAPATPATPISAATAAATAEVPSLKPFEKTLVRLKAPPGSPEKFTPTTLTILDTAGRELSAFDLAAPPPKK